MQDNATLYFCSICGKHYKKKEITPSALIGVHTTQEIKNRFPAWGEGHFICHQDLALVRAHYIQSLIFSEKGELTNLEEGVIDSLKQQELLSTNVEHEIMSDASFLERLTDKVARFGGSWWFLSLFAFFILVWIEINTFLFWLKPIDPYPYIFLNLLLSCISAIQAPIIMMSQNRKEFKDRIRAQHDYQINLKSELEIRHLHEKMDHLLLQQWEKMVKIQEMQLEMLSELHKNKVSFEEER